jgi:hypothetical protein
MHVDGRVHERAGQQEAFGGLDVALGEDELAVDKGELSKQSLGIDCAVGNTGVVSIPDEVVHPVDIEFTGDELAELALAGDKTGDVAGVEIVSAEDLAHIAGIEQFVNVVVVFTRFAVGEPLNIVAKRAMANVM